MVTIPDRIPVDWTQDTQAYHDPSCSFFSQHGRCPIPSPASCTIGGDHGRQIDWELASFYCPDCAQNYCRADWRTHVQFDEGSCDCTMGRCPRGHEHMIDD